MILYMHTAYAGSDTACEVYHFVFPINMEFSLMILCRFPPCCLTRNGPLPLHVGLSSVAPMEIGMEANSE